MRIVDNTPVRILAIITAIVGFAIYHFYIRVPNQKSQAYEGTVLRTEVDKDRVGSNNVNRTYYLVIDTDAGERREVQVPLAVWHRAEANAPVKKIAGQRYPAIMTEEAIKKREAVDDVNLP